MPFFDGRRLTMRHRTTPKNKNMIKLSLTAAIALLAIGQGYGQYTSFNNFDGKTQQLCVRDIVQSADGTMWLAAENGLYSFDGYHLVPQATTMTDGSAPGNLGSFNRIENLGDSLVIACNKATLSFNLTDRTFRRIGAPDPASDTDFMQRTTATLLDGRRIWLGSARCLRAQEGGQTTVELAMPVVKCLSKGFGNDILVGTDDGLFVVSDGEIGQHISHNARRSNSIAGDAVWCICRTSADDIWFGTNCGVSMISGSKSISTYALPDITGRSTGNQIHVAFKDSRHRLWLGGTNGLICIEGLGTPSQQCRWYAMNDSQYPLPHNRVRCICESDGYGIVMGSDAGIHILNEGTRQFELLRIGEDKHNWVYDIASADDNQLCVTTFDATYLLTIDRTAHNVGVNSTLPKKALGDGGRQLVAKFGLGDEYLSAYQCDAEGIAVLGGTDKFAVIDLSAIGNETRRAPRVTDIRVNGTEYVGHNAHFNDGIFHVAPDSRLIEIMFSDFDFGRQLPTGYQYRRDDTEWLPIGGNGCTLTLTDLDYGSHRIEIRPTNGGRQLSFTLTVDAPWFATWWAKTLYATFVLMLSAAVALLVRQRRKIALQQAAHDTLKADAQAKEEQLKYEKEHLATQLRIQMLGKMNDGKNLSADDEFLLRVTTIIEDNLSDDSLDVTRLGEMCGTNSKRLYRKLKELTGMTAVAYIRDMRLRKAALLLEKGDLSVTEVMYSVGFSNPSYFTRCFQEAYGTTPSDYKSARS